MGLYHRRAWTGEFSSSSKEFTRSIGYLAYFCCRVKDCDVTWLYGPLKLPSNIATSITSVTPSRLGTPDSSTGQKSILKRKTVLESILQRSMSQLVLVPEAGNSCSQPFLRRRNTNLSQLHHWVGGSMYSRSDIPTASLSCGVASPGERRHIHFDDEVVQCIAIDDKYVDDDEWPDLRNSESLFGSVVMARRLPDKKSLGSGNISSNSFSGRGKTITRLPSTTLQHGRDIPEPCIEAVSNRMSTISIFSKLCQWLSRSSETS